MSYTDFDGNAITDPETIAALEKLGSMVQGPEPEGWRPEPGDTVVGIVTDIDEGSNEYGEYPLLTVQTKDGNVRLHAFHTIFADRINRLINKGKLTEGDFIAVRYDGQTGEAKNGHDAFHNYRVSVQRQNR